MKSGHFLRNIILAIFYLCLLPLAIVLGIFLYPPYAIATNRHGLSDRLANSPLAVIPTIENGGIQSAITVFVAIFLIMSVLGALAPAESGSALEGDTGDTPAGGSSTDQPTESDAGDTSSTADETTDSSETESDSVDSTTGSGEKDNTAGEETTDDSTTDSGGEDTTDDSSTSDETDDTDTSDNSLTVKVVDVVDGDTVDIAYQNGTKDTVRLLGVDTPEVHTYVSSDEFEGVPDTSAGRQCLADYGEQASAFAEQELAGETVTIRFDEAADRRGYYDRLIAYIVVDGTNFNYQLIDDGYARVFDSTFSQSSRFYDAEATAQSDRTGVWECRAVEDDSDESESSGSAQLGIAQIHEDARGDEYENLNDEYIVFENIGDEALDLSGWTVEDEAGATYEFPTGFTLQPGDEVTLHTGSGQDSSTDLYWGYERPIWNNGGDTVIVKNTNGEVVLREEYS